MAGSASRSAAPNTTTRSGWPGSAVPGANITLPRGRNPGRPPDNYLDTTRLQQDTGFRPEYDVERAVPNYVGWLTSNPR